MTKKQLGKLWVTLNKREWPEELGKSHKHYDLDAQIWGAWAVVNLIASEAGVQEWQRYLKREDAADE